MLRMQGILTGAFTFLLCSLALTSCVFNDNDPLFIEEQDTFTDGLEIPKNITIEYPAPMDFGDGRPDSISNRKVDKTELQLYNSFQPGLYEYDFWTGRIDSGTVYLKAFEITKGIPLSTDRLPGRSELRIGNPTDSIQKFSSSNHFTIYEGDWGQPYAARFEVWFRPDNGDKERKLAEKNYVIEGWMR